MKALIVAPPPSNPGGVANYYKLFKQYFTSDEVKVGFHYIAQHTTQSTLLKLISILLGVPRFLLKAPGYDLIVINPSLNQWTGIYRDGLYHFLAKRVLGKPTIIFFRGWSDSTANSIQGPRLRRFKSFYSPDYFIVLAERFKESLVSWGYPPEKIIVETTAFEGKHLAPTIRKDIQNIMFISRFVKEKGCLLAIQVFHQLLEKYPGLHLYMVGDGQMKQELVAYVDKHHTGANITFTGYLRGEEKYNIFKKSDLFLFPTYHDEGMPNAMLEAMGAGQVVISRPVGGIPDIIKEGENGFLIAGDSEGGYVEKIEHLLQNKEKIAVISANNIKKAGHEFEITKVVKRLENHFMATKASYMYD